MKSIFATVGTTSFDEFVRSLCSVPFLFAMSNHHCRSSLCSSFHEHDLSLELVIQYGRGQCPRSFLPPSLVETSSKTNVDDDDGSSGSVLLSIPTKSTPSGEDIAIPSTDEQAKGRVAHNSKSSIQNFHTVHVSWYGFKPSLSYDMEKADIILTHAGAGTLLEAMRISSGFAVGLSANESAAKQRIVNAVINSKLMNNHQLELAEELERRGHIRVTRDCATEWTTENGATAFWGEIGEFVPKPFGGGRSVDSDQNYVSSFQRIVDGVMGFHQKIWSADDSHKKIQ
mmetsp:Transcript_8072/g.17489  ORF Transcript_8072/g.17489 Transcript_8072/m.17489 type:complete len:285 (-) Transcript_8072:47-901(-)